MLSFARRGLDLVLVARAEHRLKRIAERISADTGRSVRILPADLTNNPDLIRVERAASTISSAGAVAANLTGA